MTQREFPTRPLVGVGAVIMDGGRPGDGARPDRREQPRVLLARRGRAPALGEWSIPGGLVKVGEQLEAAVVREVLEETGLRVRVGAMIELLDRIIYEEEPKQRKQGRQRAGVDASGTAARVQYHYVIIDYLCRLAPRCSPLMARASTDVTELRWATRREVAALKLHPALKRVLRKAFASA